MGAHALQARGGGPCRGAHRDKFLRDLASVAFDGFVASARQLPSWTLLVTTVELSYSGGYSETTDENGVTTGLTRVRGDDADYDALDAGLATFFGESAMGQAPWVRAWCNREAGPYAELESLEAAAKTKGERLAKALSELAARKHDRGQPPLTRIRDAADEEKRPSVSARGGRGNLVLAQSYPSMGDSKRPYLTAATIDLTFAGDAKGAAQVAAWCDPPNAPPRHMFAGPVASLKCRGADTVGRAGEGVKFMIRTIPSDAKFLESAILILPVVDGVFDVICSCDIVGLN